MAKRDRGLALQAQRAAEFAYPRSSVAVVVRGCVVVVVVARAVRCGGCGGRGSAARQRRCVGSAACRHRAHRRTARRWPAAPRVRSAARHIDFLDCLTAVSTQGNHPEQRFQRCLAPRFAAKGRLSPLSGWGPDAQRAHQRSVTCQAWPSSSRRPWQSPGAAAAPRRRTWLADVPGMAHDVELSTGATAGSGSSSAATPPARRLPATTSPTSGHRWRPASGCGHHRCTASKSIGAPCPTRARAAAQSPDGLGAGVHRIPRLAAGLLRLTD